MIFGPVILLTIPSRIVAMRDVFLLTVWRQNRSDIMSSEIMMPEAVSVRREP